MYDYGDAPTDFYLIKSGSIRFEHRSFEEAMIPAMVKVEGEWVGFESFICGRYKSMTHEQL